MLGPEVDGKLVDRVAAITSAGLHELLYREASIAKIDTPRPVVVGGEKIVGP